MTDEHTHEDDLDCYAIVEHMHLFFDGELTQVQAHRIELHLAGCEDCEDGYNAEYAMRQAIKRCLCAESAPGDLRSKIASLHITIRHEEKE